MATFGKTTNGTSSSSSGSNRKRVSAATPASGGVVTSLTCRIWDTTGTVLARGVIYADSAGAPGALLAVSDEATMNNAAEADFIFTFSGANQITVVGGTQYWIGVIYGVPSAGLVAFSRDSTANGHMSDADTYSDGAANPYGTSTVSAGIIDCYVTYTPGGTTIKTVAGVTQATIKFAASVALAAIKKLAGVTNT